MEINYNDLIKLDKTNLKRKEITSVKFPIGINIIKEDAFYGCSNLLFIKLPSSLTKIEAWAFAFCNKLNSIEFPEKLSEIDEYAFIGCSSLMSLVLPKQIDKLGNGAFEQCINLKAVKILSEIEVLEESIFGECINLRNIVLLTKTLKYIHIYAFRACSSIPIDALILKQCISLIKDEKDKKAFVNAIYRKTNNPDNIMFKHMEYNDKLQISDDTYFY